MTGQRVFGVVRFESKLPPAIAALETNSNGIRVLDDQIMFDDLQRSPWRDVLSAVSRVGCRLARAGSYGLTLVGYESPRQAISSDGIVGAVIEADPNAELRCVNPQSDFGVAIPPPCAVPLPLDKTIDIDKRPRHLIVSAGANLIYSERFLIELNWKSKGMTFPVRVKSRPVTDYCRWIPTATADALNSLCRKPAAACAVCGSTIESPVGVWISNLPASMIPEVCINRDGFGHSRHELPVVVSWACANRIVSSFGTRGYALEPVFDQHSALGQNVSEFHRWITEIHSGRE